MLAVIAVALAALTSVAAPPESALAHPDRVEIRFFDVGQGDAALITSPDGRRVLVDGGPRGSGVAAYLRRNGIDTLDLVVASHNHVDHIGGLREVFDAAVVRNYMENGLPSATVTYTRLLDAVARNGARVLEATDRTLTLGAMTVRVLAPLPTAATQNDRSIGLVIELGEFRALFTGDAERTAITRWLEDSLVPRMSVVKVPHHGSSNGTTARFVRATHPLVAVIPVGAENQYGHPHRVALRVWSNAARHVLRTDQHGTVTVYGARDGSMNVSTSRGTPRLRDLFIPARPVTAEITQ